MNTEQKHICVSRPRRFGKSMALKMLAAYYSRGCDSTELFRGFQIERMETFRKNLNKLDVILLNMQQFLIEAETGKATEYLEQEVIGELREIYGEFFSEKETILAMALRKIFVRTKRKFVFLIDEWDCMMRERQESETLQKQYLDFLRNLLKDQPYVTLAYNDENSLAAAIGLAYYSARKDYKIIRELPAGKGYADIVFLPLPNTARPALVIELKYDTSISSAIQQIKDRQYTQALEGCSGEILLVDISYHRQNRGKPHSCVIEKIDLKR